jgi:hypothetical protein
MKKELSHEGQFEYLGKWVDKHSFRAFVYNEKGEEKLANSHKEFEDLTSSGIWYSSKDLASKGRKPKNDSIRAAS